MKTIAPWPGIALVTGLLFAPLAGNAQGEHSRRVAAELVVVQSDLQRLQQTTVTAQHKRGLQQRMEGVVTTLEMLLRSADAEQRKTPIDHRPGVRQLHRLLKEGRYQQLQRQLETLQVTYPLEVPTWLPQASCSDVALQLHRQRCAACHDAPAISVERPAYNLYREARQLSLTQMFARMLIGVRGDRVSGIDNPLSDLQIAALMGCYRGRTNSVD